MTETCRKPWSIKSKCIKFLRFILYFFDNLHNHTYQCKMPFLPGFKNALLLSAQFFHSFLIRNQPKHGHGNDKFDLMLYFQYIDLINGTREDKFDFSNIWLLRAFSPGDLFSLGERLPSKNSDTYFNSTNCLGIP